MNSSLQDRLDQLTIELKEKRRLYQKSLRNVIYFSVIILVFFSLYSAMISYKIREIATPSTVALLIAGQLRDHFENSVKTGNPEFRRTAGDMSQTALLALPMGIHGLGELLRESMTADEHRAALEISKILEEELHRRINVLMAGPEKRKTMPGGLQPVPDLKKISRTGRTLLFPVPLAFGSRLREIRHKRNSALTRQDLCDRDFMLCWLFLNEHERYRDTVFSGTWIDFSGDVLRAWEDVVSSKPEPVQKNTKNNPIPKNIPNKP